MPVYEGIGLSGEKTAVIFDIGRAYTKCGFAGESGPRCIIPSEIKRPKSNEVAKLHVTSYSDNELYSVLVDFLHHIYFRHLLVNPKERRVIVVESILSTTTRFRNILASVFFRHFEVPSLLFESSHVISLYTLGIPSGIVLDCGYSETVVLPVYEGVPLLNAWQALPLASKAIHQFLDSNLKEIGMMKNDQNVEVPLSTVEDILNEKTLEDIKVRTCFATRLERAKAVQNAKEQQNYEGVPEPPPNVEYPLDGNRILIIPGKTREVACEVLFERDSEETSIATLVLDSLLKCSMDTRRTLAENIVLVGGTPMLLGFKHRLMSELHDLVSSTKYKQLFGNLTFKLHSPPAKDNYVAWLGGAMFGSLDVVGTRSLTRDQYLKGVPLTDWCSLYVVDDVETSRISPPK